MKQMQLQGINPKPKGNWKIREKIETLKEVRYLLYLIQDAVTQMTKRCKVLRDSADELRKDNGKLKNLIDLHQNRLDSSVKKTFVTSNEIKRKGKTLTKNLSLNKALGKKKFLEKYLKNVHLWETMTKYPRRPSKTMSFKLREEFESFYEDIFAENISEFKVRETYNLHWTERFIIHLDESITRCKKGMFYSLMCIAIIVYTLIGAFTFLAVEGYYERTLINEILEKRAKLENMEMIPDSVLNEYYDFLAEKYKLNKYLFARGDELSWNLSGAIFFCATTYTTIGYGDITPVTTAGKILTMIYAFFGIPLFLIFLGYVGETFANFIYRTSDHVLQPHTNIGKPREVRELKKVKNIQRSVSKRPMLKFFTIEIIYVLLGAIIFMWSKEHLQYLDSLYFTIITLYTIGFGDYILDRKYMLGCVIYVIGGLALTSVGFSLTKKILKKNVNSATYKLNQAIGELRISGEP